jgi:hypothetical protein
MKLEKESLKKISKAILEGWKLKGKLGKEYI